MELTTAIDNKWGTPYDLFEFANHLFGDHDLDAAAEADWKMCENFIDEKQNALDPNTVWNGSNIWINPPYDIKNITAFVTRAIKESKNGKAVTLLLPVKSDQQWFHDLLKEKVEFVFIKKRVKFRRRNGLPAIGASFPVMLVHLNDMNETTTIISYEDCIKEFSFYMENEKIIDIYSSISEEIDKEIISEFLAAMDNIPDSRWNSGGFIQ